jgi:CHAT domain-containing protein
MSAMEEEQNGLDRLAGGHRTEPGSGCPPANKLASLAAGLFTAEQCDALLDHVSGCDACGAILRSLVEDFAEEIVEVESRMPESLESSKPDWQRAIARRMARASRGQASIPIRTWLAKAAALILAAGGGWLAWEQWIAPNPARLLAQAYTEQRPFEFRIPGARHARVAPQERRGGSAFGRPRALNDAWSAIKNQLGNNPEDTMALRLEARATLMERDIEDAFATLQHALELTPDDPDLLADLGLAYALRARSMPDRAVDYGYAIDYLEQSLRAKPKSNEAVFNLALVYEDMNSVEDAIREWRHYLTLDQSGPWHDEAQGRLSGFEQKQKLRQSALERISDKNPARLLRSIERGEAVEPEEYLEVAVTEWLPRRWQGAGYQRALNELAKRFEEQHHDPWLRDLLAAERSESMVRGLAALAEAVEANLRDDTVRALEQSAEASRLFRAAHSEAGALRAEFELTYALDRALKRVQCLGSAVPLYGKVARLKYSWLVVQTLLEQRNCRGRDGDAGAASQDLRLALEEVHRAGYKDLELRAEGIFGGVGTTDGDLNVAWKLGRKNLGAYWSGSYSGTRGFQIYWNLFRAAQSLGHRQAALVFARAATQAIAETPHRRDEATTRARAAELALEAGWPQEAKVEFDRVRTMFDQLAQAETDLEYRAVAELYSAEADLVTGAPGKAEERLKAVRAQTEGAGLVVRIRLEEILADALERQNRKDEAKTAYLRAIDLSEQRLKEARGIQARVQLNEVIAKAYRGLVELQWQNGDPVGALQTWETFRTGEAPGPRGPVDFARLREPLRSEALLSYVVLPHGVLAWVLDSQAIEARQIAVKPEELERVTSRFLRECADRDSNLNMLRRDGRQLYNWLVAPLAHRLNPSIRTLLIEPHGAVGAIPFQALVDEKSRYLGERFAIAVVGGLVDYLRRAEIGPVTLRDRALVVTNPILGAGLTSTFPPLAGTFGEGRSVASRFHSPMLLPGMEATIQAVEERSGQANVFHFAGHGFSNAGNGGLLLSPGETDTNGAGILDGTRMAQQNWRQCRLAVLAACSSGSGEAKEGVNPESLVRGLLWAGVARVVASRWNVDTEKGAAFMDQFYDELLSGRDTAAALQEAAKRLRERTETGHPYFWSGFQTFGAR